MPNHWYVDPRGTDDELHGMGPGADAWKTLGYGLWASNLVGLAKPLPNDGDTLHVVYAEKVTRCLHDGTPSLLASSSATTWR